MKRLILSIILSAVCAIASAADTALVRMKTKDGKSTEKTLKLEEKGAFQRAQIAVADIPQNIETIEVFPSFAKAKAGDDGYYIMPDGMYGKFSKRAKDGKYSMRHMPVALSGMKKGDWAFAAILKGMRFECNAVVTYKKGAYEMSYFFNLKDDKPYEDILIDFYPLTGKDANYSGMGRLYRKWQLERGEVRPLKERAAENENLAYAADAPEVRIRQGWKPVPSPVLMQTLETEPKMKVAMTFDRVSDLLDEFKAQGVDKAQICLVGWNIRGHDGRYPTLYPVEPALGGEEKLRALTKKAKEQGIKLVCHTNTGDCYHISPDWSVDITAKKPDGTPQKNATWAGGQMFNLCYKVYSEKFLERDYPKLKDLGFEGLHYIDVLSTVTPTVCYDKKHPLNRKQAAEEANKHLKYAADLIGGAASEGGFDHVAKTLDYGLYITFKLFAKRPPLIDGYIPLWHIIYNGIIMSNAGTATVNYTIKDKASQMKVVEFGTRPSYYIHSAFCDTGRKNWMGDNDLVCTTEADLKKTVSEIKKGREHLKEMGYLQYEFLDNHEEIAPNVFKSEFSDGSVIISNYTDKAFAYNDETIDSMSNKLFKPSWFSRLFNWL